MINKRFVWLDQWGQVVQLIIYETTTTKKWEFVASESGLVLGR